MCASKTVYPSGGFYFQVKVENETYSFKEVSGISLEITTEEIAESGENRFKYKVPTSQRYSDLVLKRGLVPENSELDRWIYNTLNLGFDKPIETKTLEVSLININGNKIMTWSFVNAWPLSWNIASLNAMNNEVLIESINLSYNYFTTKIIT
ncbi:phage tail protein [Psychroserpens sp. AS72]|uniref:phage tail protein n=1 Tax=Psychroserpens sp. AS72 TaxID=3135775 RepID=UPI0031823F73